MSTTGSSSTPDRMYSKLIDDRNQDDFSFRTDVQHSDYPASPVRNSGRYRIATICLAFFCAVLLVSIIAVAAHNKKKSETSVEATSAMQKSNPNITALIDTITKLQQEKKQLEKENDELKTNLTLISTKVINPTAKTTSSVQCAVDWQLFNNNCYLISRFRRTWNESQTFCQEHGAHLAIILTAEEQTFLWNLLPRGHWNSYWFGITDAETEDKWIWIDGTPLVGGFWEDNEPNNHINEDCGYIVKTMVLERVATKSWYDAPCTMFLPFICEKEMANSPQ